MINKGPQGKRDREKLKAQKRQEKQERKLKNRSEGSKSFDDMIAYVDEFGILHATPPEPKKKNDEEDDLSAIVISTPKQVDEVDPVITGTVDFFNADKGFGFIINDRKKEKYFFHISSAFAGIKDGNKVTFEIEKGPRGLIAINIQLIKN